MRRSLATLLATLSLSALGACAGSGADPAPEDGQAEAVADLPLGDLDEATANAKADGAQWGSALSCKPIPNLPVLAHPEVTISLQGLTLHLVDKTVGYDKVFAVGTGKIDPDPAALTFGESLSYWPPKAYRTQQFYFRQSTSTACKFWWTDPDTGEKTPVFAGLPFMSWSGSYGIHGPIDGFTAPNGGTLRRGFVSHGCVRMEAADILEVYARTKGLAQVSVRVQREPERRADGTRVDLTSRWVGAECRADSDCNFAGGFCKQNPYSERGFCSAHCSKYCTDRAGNLPTFCVADPDDATQGMCVVKSGAPTAPQNPDCRTYDHLEPMTVGRFSQPGATASACVPGTTGAIGEHCFLDTDCATGNTCAGAAGGQPGLCTLSCTRSCPDPAGVAATLCVNEAALGGPVCMRTCTPGTNAPECPGGTACVLRGRNGEAATQKYVCEPK